MKLEEYIEKNKEALDQTEIPIGHQKRFEKKLQQKQHSRWPKLVLLAAGLAALVSISVNLVYLSQGKLEKDFPNGQSTNAAIGIYDIEVFYKSRIEETKETIMHPSAVPGEDSLLSIHLEALESNYQQLKSQLEEAPNDQRLVHYMVANYRLRLQLLEMHVAKTQKNLQTKK